MADPGGGRTHRHARAVRTPRSSASAKSPSTRLMPVPSSASRSRCSDAVQRHQQREPFRGGGAVHDVFDRAIYRHIARSQVTGGIQEQHALA